MSRIFLRLRPAIAAIMLVSAVAVAPVSAQDDAAIVAPAIGPWLGLPRGSISNVTGFDGGVGVQITASDRDSVAPIPYELLVDGAVARSSTLPRAASFGDPVEGTTWLELSEGLHEICLRLRDPRQGRRTVDCVTASTAPPDTVSPALAQAATGALVSPSGVVLPVRGGGPGRWQVTTPCGAETEIASGTFIARARVVIDPGHGGSESGAVGGGLLEKDLNLLVSERLADKLESLGISTAITRTADYRVPIRTRADIATALAPDVFISVHHNGGALRPSNRPGTEVFYANGIDESQRLAAIMYEEMVAALQPYQASWVSTVNEGASLRLRGDGQDLYGIHRFSPDVTSVISEFLYLSNPSEAALMQRPELIEVEAQAIVDSLLRWWWTTDDGTELGREFTDSSSSGTGGFDNCSDPDLLTPRPNVGLSAAPPQRSMQSMLLPALQLAEDPAP